MFMALDFWDWLDCLFLKTDDIKFGLTKLTLKIEC